MKQTDSDSQKNDPMFNSWKHLTGDSALSHDEMLGMLFPQPGMPGYQPPTPAQAKQTSDYYNTASSK